VAGWERVVAGVVIGVAGTIYATNEDVRKRLPKAARELPDNVRRRYKRAVSAGRDASARRRQEILHDLEEHGGGHHTTRGTPPGPGETAETDWEPAQDGPVTDASEEASEKR
jgi:hypothetical protein